MTFALFVLGCLLLVAGVALWSYAAALVVAGLILAVGAFLWEFGGADEGGEE
jgi:hypothetical protein